MDFSDYYFEDLGLNPLDFDSFPKDAILLPICWVDDDGHFLSMP